MDGNKLSDNMEITEQITMKIGNRTAHEKQITSKRPSDYQTNEGADQLYNPPIHYIIFIIIIISFVIGTLTELLF